MVSAMDSRIDSTQRPSLQRTLPWIYAVFICLVIAVRAVIEPPQSSDLSNVLREGQRQYELIQEKSNLPDSGQCWRNAVVRLQSGCRHLTESLQTDLALRFADCFMRSSGHPGIECLNNDAEVDSFARQTCLRNLTDRVFLTYTEFYTHSQSMCLFLMSQVWHQETQKTIDKLSSSASDVSKRLEEAGKIQETLLDGQKESISMQQTLLDNSHHLGHIVHESASTLSIVFKEFRSTAAEQQQLLGQVFHHLSAMQSWIVGEVSWVDSLVFYISTTFLAYLVTSARRVSDARFPLIIILLLSAAAERLLANFILAETNDHESMVLINTLKEQLYWWLWILRRASLLICGIVLTIIFYRYSDQEQQRHQLLLQIFSQNKEMISFLQDKILRQDVKRSCDVPDSIGYTAVSVTPGSYGMGSPSIMEASPSATALHSLNHSSPTLRRLFDYSFGPGTPALDSELVTSKLATPSRNSLPKKDIVSEVSNEERSNIRRSFDERNESREGTPLSIVSDGSELTPSTDGMPLAGRKKGSRSRSRSRKRSPGRKRALEARQTPYNLRRTATLVSV